VTRDLQDEHVVGVVVHAEALRRGRRAVGVRLHGPAQLGLEAAAVDGRRVPMQVQRLQDDRRARGVLLRHTVDEHGAREAARAPGDVRRVGRWRELRTVLDEPEGGHADRAVADDPFDVRVAEHGVEAPSRSALDMQRPALGVLVEELGCGDGIEREA
jgi:hypothetical protein